MARIGSIIDNKYEVLKEIGHGGMSTVYLAMDKRLNKQWAIKEIKKIVNDKNNEIIVQSLLIEANLMKRLDHPALPRIVDIIDNGNTIFVIMDYIEGESLDKILLTTGAQPQNSVIEWARQLCDVLRYLHSQKPPIIYRDMKPANIMLKPEGTLKVIDFGIAREFKEHNMSDTVSLGTRGYAAPEQFGGMGQTDARTDIYGLGVTLYHLITGQNPSEPPYEMYPIRQWNQNLSSGLEAIIQKCTQLNPEDRYQNCNELMYALEHYNEMDENYRKKQKNKLRLFIVSIVASAFCCVSGSVFNVLSTRENTKSYEQKINISSSTNYSDKINIYSEAIGLYPYRYDAYIKLLEAYNDNNLFTDVESTEFMNFYNVAFNERNIRKYDIMTDEYSEMNYNAGILYFYLYNLDDTNISLKVRALKAHPFFECIIKSNNTAYENYELVESYYTICDFYKNYVANSSNTKEPTYEIYMNLVTSLEKCINNLDEYDNENLPYIKLTVYDAIMDLIYSQRKGFVASGVEQIYIEDILNRIYDNTNSLYVTQEKSINKQNLILENITGYMQEIINTYDNKKGTN